MSDALRDALAALEPFAKASTKYPDKLWEDGSVPWKDYAHACWGIDFTIGDLRRAAKAYEALRANSSDVSVPTEHHCHVCEGCGHIWWHQKTEWTRAERDAAHRCPKCGCGPYRTSFSTMRDALESRKQLREADAAMLSASPQAKDEPNASS